MGVDYKIVWKDTLAELEKHLEISVVAFELFIKPLEPVELTNSQLILKTELKGNKETIESRYLSFLNQAIAVKYPGFSVKAVTPEELEQREKAVVLPDTQELFPSYSSSKLQEKYTFDTFVVGQNNRLVHAAAKAIVEHPGLVYNPLFIYGASGLGKTHIMQAIGNATLAMHPNLSIIYVTCENFVNDFIGSIRMGKDRSAMSFRNRYRNCDMLLIDDIQFIAKKTATQEELFHTFNDLRENGKQIILTSDCHPREINPLEDRLRTRFSGGLIADILPPDFETRVAILQKKALLNNYNVPQDVLEYIADQNEDSVRTLEENLTRAYFFASLSEMPLTVEVTKEALRDGIIDEDTLDIDTIIDVACSYYHLSREELIGKKKTREIAFPRQMCIYIITEILPVPLTTIGSIFGGRDHTTIMHARDKISDELKHNPAIKTALSEIRTLLYKK